jgi:allantoinase
VRAAGFETATSAAAAGGITTMVDMPLNSVPCTISAEFLRQKVDASKVRVSHCNHDT